MKTLLGGWHKRNEGCELKIIVLDDGTELQIEDVSYSIERDNNTDAILSITGIISIRVEEVTDPDTLINSLIDIEIVIPTGIYRIQKAELLQGEPHKEKEGLVELHFISNKIEILQFNRTLHQHTEEEIISGLLSQ